MSVCKHDAVLEAEVRRRLELPLDQSELVASPAAFHGGCPRLSRRSRCRTSRRATGQETSGLTRPR